jgi:hypothetical protein
MNFRFEFEFEFEFEEECCGVGPRDMAAMWQHACLVQKLHILIRV